MSAARASRRTVAGRLLRAEAAGYRSIARWVRRRPDVPEGTEAFGYAQLSAPMMWLFVIVSAIEVPVAHVLLHAWPWVQWPVTAVGVWSLVWMVALVAGVRTHPHLLAEAVLRVRSGPGVDVEVPLARVARAVVTEQDLSSSMRVVELLDASTYAVGVSGRTNLRLELDAPLTLPAPGLGADGTVEATTVALWADDPRELARRLRAGAASAS